MTNEGAVSVTWRGRFIGALLFLLGALLLSCAQAAAPDVRIVPDGGPIVLGQSLQLVATRHYPDGTVENVTQIVDWSTSNNDALHLVSPALNPGLIAAQTASTTVFITAEDPASGQVFTSTFTVVPSQLKRIDLTPSPAISLVRGETHTVTAIGNYTDGSSADITDKVLWSSSNEAVAVVSNAQGTRGVVTAGAAGNTSITATDGVTGIAGTTLVFVSGNPVLPAPPTLTAIVVAPNPETIAVGAKTQFTATGIYSDGSAQVFDAVTWTSSTPTVASIDGTGLATGLIAGNTTITATGNGTSVRASAALTVTP